jgi:hypothetical protein
MACLLPIYHHISGYQHGKQIFHLDNICQLPVEKVIHPFWMGSGVASIMLPIDNCCNGVILFLNLIDFLILLNTTLTAAYAL